MILNRLLRLQAFTGTTVGMFIGAGGDCRGCEPEDMAQALLKQIESPHDISLQSPRQPIHLTPLPESADCLITFAGMFRPTSTYTKNLLETSKIEIEKRMPFTPDMRLLEIGCGTGVIALDIAQSICLKVDCVDIQPLAVANTTANAIYWGATDLIKAWQSDGLQNVADRYDVIMFNAPLVVDCDSDHPNTNDPFADTMRGIFAILPYHLKPGGKLLMMNSIRLEDHLPTNLKSEIAHRFDVHDSKLAVHAITVR